MPQLAPMNWIAIFIFTISLVFMITSLIWWYYFPTFKFSYPNLSSPQLKWKW